MLCKIEKRGLKIATVYAFELTFDLRFSILDPQFVKCQACLAHPAHQLARVEPLATAADLLHHALHLLELADQRSDILQLCAAALGDALLAPALD